MFKFHYFIVLSVVLMGCSATGIEHQADVYDSSEVNTQQKAQVITILGIQPAKIKVDNSENQKRATKAVGLIGGALGAFVGNQSGNAGLGGLVGGGAGAVAGSMTESQSIVEGVTLIYRLDNETFTSAQVGRLCQFKEGQALMVMSKEKETRIQPNAECPADE